jgi:signal transduction histidine kinase
MARLICLTNSLCLSLILFACSETNLKPQAYPYILDVVKASRGLFHAYDLTGDGVDELLYVRSIVDDPDRVYKLAGELHGMNYHGAVTLYSQDNKVIGQLNYPGIVGPPHVLDLDADGANELVVTFIRNDSLFVAFANGQGEKLFSFFLIAGKPRIEDNSILDWDPSIQAFYLSDVDGDGRKELITVIFTGYARLPRGILIHSLPEGRLLGKLIVGAAIIGSYMSDFNDDGIEEIIAYSVATSNGASANGFDDNEAFIINFNLKLPVEINWSHSIGELWAASNLFYDDFDGDRKKEFLAITFQNYTSTDGTKLELIDPVSWQVTQQRKLNELLALPQIIDLNRDLKLEILAIKEPGEVWVFDNLLRTLRRKKFAKHVRRLKVLPDIDGDGVNEIIASTISEKLLLNANLEIKGSVPLKDLYMSGNIEEALIRRGPGLRPDIILNGVEKSIIVRLRENRWYLLYRYGPATLWGIGILLTLSLPIAFIYWRRHDRKAREQRIDELESEIKKAKTWMLMAQQVAHEIRNPLTSVLLTLQRLQMEYRDRSSQEVTEQLDTYSARIYERIEALRLMTRNFMKFVDVEKLNLVSIDFTHFIQSGCEVIEKNLPPDVSLVKQLIETGIDIRIDQEQIHVLIENLIANAINAMPEGGQITVSTQSENGLHLPQISAASQDYIILEIKDTGKGIPQNILHKIFEPNFTAAEHGTGLGLVIVKKIVENHSAHIEVESELDAGSVFAIYFPVQGICSDS